MCPIVNYLQYRPITVDQYYDKENISTCVSRDGYKIRLGVRRLNGLNCVEDQSIFM